MIDFFSYSVKIIVMLHSSWRIWLQCPQNVLYVRYNPIIKWHQEFIPWKIVIYIMFPWCDSEGGVVTIWYCNMSQHFTFWHFNELLINYTDFSTQLFHNDYSTYISNRGVSFVYLYRLHFNSFLKLYSICFKKSQWLLFACLRTQD